MKAYWAIIFLICLAVGVFVILPAVAPTVTTNEMIKTSYVTAGDTFFLMNQSEIALPFYDNALQMNTTDPVILKKKGEVLIKIGRISDANQVYSQVLTQNGNDTVALVRFGDVLMQQGDFKGALPYYQTALKNDPGNAVVWVKQGDAQLLMSVADSQNIHAMAKNLSQQPGSANYQPASNDQLVTMESYQAAMKSYQKAIELDPKLSITVSTRVLGATQNQVNSYSDFFKDVQSSKG
ncbi:MAG: tetratricopeptide repeat protein [Methanoregula sp.]